MGSYHLLTQHRIQNDWNAQPLSLSEKMENLHKVTWK